MNKITADHLSRWACVYIRQFTPCQTRHRLESQRRQYNLVDRARARLARRKRWRWRWRSRSLGRRNTPPGFEPSCASLQSVPIQNGSLQDFTPLRRGAGFLWGNGARAPSQTGLTEPLMTDEPVSRDYTRELFDMEERTWRSRCRAKKTTRIQGRPASSTC
jgi:hypothetical protein